MGFRSEIYSRRYITQYGQKTYFFNIKENRFRDVFLCIVESVKTESCSEKFNRSQIAIFDPDWYLFLRFLREMEKSLASEHVRNLRTVASSQNGKRFYVFSISERSRTSSVSITEQKSTDESDGRTVVIDSTDFPTFIQYCSETISHCRSLCSSKI